MANFRTTENSDLLAYLQENTAYLKTILNHLELNSSDPVASKEININKFEEFLDQTKDLFNEKTKIKP